MATKFKDDKRPINGNGLVQAHKDELDGIKIKHEKLDALNIDPNLKQNLNELAKQVSYRVDNDPAMNYENKDLAHTLILPFSTLMVIWAFLKTLFWALVTYVYHTEKVYESKRPNPKYSGKTTVAKWFNLPAAIRTYWCIPQAKRGETLKPRYSSLFFDRFSAPLKNIRNGAASWKALDIIYNHPFKKARNIEDLLANFWIGMKNAQAVRNRHKMILREIETAILRKGEKNIRLLSVACGSAEAIIQVVKKMKDSHGIRVEVTLLDLDKKALEYASSLTQKYGVEDRVTIVNANIKVLEQVVEGKFGCMEMLGLLDYLLYKKAIALVTRLRDKLEDDGFFFTCNINPNSEKRFLRWNISWPMIYRKPQEIAKIMLAAGFEKEKISLISEPHQIHTLVVCQK